MEGIVYNDRQIKDFLKIFIHTLAILEMGFVWIFQFTEIE